MLNEIDDTAVADDELNSYIEALLREADYLLEKRSNNSTNKSTQLQYQTNVARLERRNLKPSDPSHLTHLTQATRAAYASAVVFVNIQRLKPLHATCCDFLNGVYSGDDILEIVKKLKFILNILSEYEPKKTSHQALQCKTKTETGNGFTRLRVRKPKAKSRRKTKKCKRLGIGRLPADWQAKMFRSFHDDPEMQLGLAVIEITGCRPAELQKGVTVICIEKGNFRFLVDGVKVNDTRGQPSRQIDVEYSDTHACFALANHLSWSEGGQIVVKVQNSKKFSDRIRYRSRLIFPNSKYIISAYSYRHQSLSCEKARGRDRETVAKMSGHNSAKSQSAYGTVRHGRSVVGHKILTATASRPIKKLETNSWWTSMCKKHVTQPIYHMMR